MAVRNLANQDAHVLLEPETEIDMVVSQTILCYVGILHDRETTIHLFLVVWGSR